MAALIMEVGWLMVGAASPRLTESAGFSNAMFDALPPIWAWADPLRRVQMPESASKLIFVAGLAVAGVGFVSAVGVLQRVCLHHPARWIATGVAVFSFTLLLTPGLFSTDLVTYAVYGRMAAVYGVNPYMAAPVSIAGDPLVAWTSNTVTHGSVYGPLWTALGALLAGVTAHASLLTQTFAYRLVGAFGHALNAYLIWTLAPLVAADGRRIVAVLLYAWNPLALFEFVASGHNDGIMLTLALGSLLLAFGRRRLLWAAAAMWASALVKWVSAVTLLYVLAAGLHVTRQWTERARRLASLGAILAVMTAALFSPWFDFRDLTALQTVASGDRYVNALLDLPTPWLVSHFIDRSGSDLVASEASVRSVIFGVARLLVFGYVAFEAIRLWRLDGEPRHILEASVRTLLVALLVAITQMLAWYFTWPLALAAPLGLGHKVARLAVTYAVLYLPIFYAIHEDILSTLAVPPILIMYAVLPPLSVFVIGRARPAGRLVSAKGPSAV